MGEYTPVQTTSSTGGINSTDPGFGSSFGHPLDMLARTAANTHSPDVDRFSAGNTFNGITPPAQNVQRQSLRIGPSETINTTWSTELTGIDPVERGWLDIDDAKALFEK
jgi:hypothetical protein